MNKSFTDILIPYSKPKKTNLLTRDGELLTAQVFLDQKNSNLLISKQCFDSSNISVYIQNLYEQYQLSHPAIMKLVQLSISPNNSIESYYHFPEKGKLSDYIGFAHENVLSESKILTPTQKSIISYGIANAMNCIHQHNYFFSQLNARNIYLDDQFHPYLTNFYSIKKINDKRLPKSKRPTNLHLKLDVYAYSIIYAALIEPVEFDPPVNSAKEFFERLAKHDRPISRAATQLQRDILKMMWDWIPKDRISFDKILEYFESGDLLFPGTDMDEFHSYQKQISPEAKLASPPSDQIQIQTREIKIDLQDGEIEIKEDLEEEQNEPKENNYNDNQENEQTITNGEEEEEEMNEQTINNNNDDEDYKNGKDRLEEGNDDYEEDIDNEAPYHKERAEDVQDWQPHERDDLEQGIREFQPTETDNDNDNEQQQQLPRSSSASQQAEEQKKDVKEEVKKEQPKRAKVHIPARLVERLAREAQESSSSNQSEGEEDEEIDDDDDESSIIAATPSIDSEIQYIRVSGGVDYKD
ncbi:hypothetical protein M9Y10_031207 [Tritrichomonas musculus]|uniref:Protein kinase domain-containing protein n=1 Tax=Tritrichomonas musculus TaxID=1915356 RepID=A0ABR2H228_9EUKA